MLKRTGNYLTHQHPDSAPAATRKASLELETKGYTHIAGVITAAEVAALASDVSAIFDALPPDGRAAGLRSPEEDEMYRYELLNRSRLCQALVENEIMLSTIEPLLGNDCHVIANTGWRNPAGHQGADQGQAWHIDAGPHVPLPEGVEWPADIPHPVFAIGTHVFLKDCRLADGPTGVIPYSHLSGRFPPRARPFDKDLTFNGNAVVPLIAKAGDAILFVSDIWHRRLPAGPAQSGRFFVQIHYARRDIAQRLRSTSHVNHLHEDTKNHALQPRQRTVIGIHPNSFYDG